MNEKVFKPTAEAIKARYYEKYRGLDTEVPAPATPLKTSPGAGSSSDPLS